MKINGKEVHLRSGMLCVEIFLSKSLSSNTLAGGAFGVASILWGGICNYYDVKELPRPVTFEEVYDDVENQMIEGSDLEEARAFVKQFEDSVAWKKQVENIEKVSEEVKKKLKELPTENLPIKQD